jgi:selenocysteine-specific elongation factor
MEAIRRTFADAGLEVPKTDEVLKAASQVSGVNSDVARKLFQRLVDTGEIVRISPEFAISGNAMNDLVDKVRQYADKSSDRLIDVATFKSLAKVSRKYAIPLLEYLDQRKITARRGDGRLVI